MILKMKNFCEYQSLRVFILFLTKGYYVREVKEAEGQLGIP